MFSGGGSWGSSSGGGSGGGFQLGKAATRAVSSDKGLPFTGVPPELQEGVARLITGEPDHGEPDAKFTHRQPKGRPLTLGSMLRDHGRAALIGVLLVAIETAGLQSGPFLTQIGIDAIGKHHLSVVLTAGIAYVVLVLLTVGAERARVRWTGRLAAWVMNDLRIKVFAHLQRLSLDFFTEEKAGVIMTRMTADIEILQQLLQDGLAQFAIQGLSMVLITGLLFHYNVKLAVITVCMVVPLMTAFSLWFRKAAETCYRRVRDTLSGVLGDLAESLAGVRIVVAHNRQRHNTIKHRNIVGAYRQANFRSAHVNALYGAGSDAIGLGGQVALLGIGGDMLLRGQITLGVLTAFIFYLGAFFQPIQQLVQLYNTFQQAQAAIFKLRTLLETQPTVEEHEDAVELPKIAGELQLEHVYFGYDPQVPVLEDVSLTIKEGETVAFVGPTGAGKSTIAKLVTRFYDPTAGRVLLDGFDIASVTLTSLRSQLGVVPQEPFLFVGTIFENIAFARPDAERSEVEEAAKLVGLSDLLSRLPDGLESDVHERGQSLSSGERQLLALARAFLSQPRVLVLDEATSNLDLQSEMQVEAGLDVLLQGRTSILIAHRLSTAMRADRIVVVDEGRIVEVGPHAELIELGGRYAEMYATWIREGHDPPPVESVLSGRRQD